MTESAPAAKAFEISPVYLTPPSAINVTLEFLRASETSKTADNWGKPTPATTLVVHIEPGPIPTFIPSAPFSLR